MATQAFLDATRGGSYTTPTEWNQLANLWEGSRYDAVQAQEWIAASVETPSVADALVDRGITPGDALLVSDFVNPQNLPPLQDAIAAIGVLKGIRAAGLSSDQTVAVLSTFFSELEDGRVDLTLLP